MTGTPLNQTSSGIVPELCGLQPGSPFSGLWLSSCFFATRDLAQAFIVFLLFYLVQSCLSPNVRAIVNSSKKLALALSWPSTLGSHSMGHRFSR